ncbi:hypothetical protein [Arthrobacter sp. PsM3]|uniref:hypothetical protein n=1 Tax=Arthrobacter sp. PsM3 TaxID=3030531 RepID=UPI00263B527B|nr:hypothetical protein [Arthrobacter sp. PsM3]MDN4644249.1 hypothetical protein [Arthrobacter sp. PsM3]
MKSRPRLVRAISLSVVALFLLAGASDCGQAIKSAIAAVGKGSDDAAKVVVHSAQPSELNSAAKNLDDLVAKVPERGSLSPQELKIIANAEDRAAAFREFATLLGVSDGVSSSITSESWILVRGSLIGGSHPSDAFVAYMDNLVKGLVKDTTCSSFAALMSAQQTQDVAQYTTTFTRIQPSEAGVRKGVEDHLTTAGYMLEEVRWFLDTAGFSSKIVGTAKGYVGKMKSAVSATAWNNSGATNAYLRLCVFN